MIRVKVLQETQTHTFEKRLADMLNDGWKVLAITYGNTIPVGFTATLQRKEPQS